jgi:hypothetical protein
MALPNPELMADAQAVNVFAQAISQSASQLANNTNPDSPEYQPLKQYFNTNIPKLRALLDKLEADLGN